MNEFLGLFSSQMIAQSPKASVILPHCLYDRFNNDEPISYFLKMVCGVSVVITCLYHQEARPGFQSRTSHGGPRGGVCVNKMPFLTSASKTEG